MTNALLNIFFAGAAFGAASVALNGRKLSALVPVFVLFAVALAITGGYSTWLGYDFLPFLIPWVATSILGAIAGGLALIATATESVAAMKVWLKRDPTPQPADAA
jgi:hypothetical protein